MKMHNVESSVDGRGTLLAPGMARANPLRQSKLLAAVGIKPHRRRWLGDP